MFDVPYINLTYFYELIYRIITGELLTDLWATFLPFAPTLKQISTFLSLFLMTGIVYVAIRMRQIRKIEREKLEALPEIMLSEQEPKDERWEKVLRLLEGQDSNNWRLAILEADIMLDELVTSMGYHGENLGEKLKGVEKSDFVTIDKAWEAHKTRNKIAHEGSDFILTQREARRIVDLFKEVFEEFHYL